MAEESSIKCLVYFWNEITHYYITSPLPLYATHCTLLTETRRLRNTIAGSLPWAVCNGWYHWSGIGVLVDTVNWCMMASCWIGVLVIVLKDSPLRSLLDFYLSLCHCKVYSLYQTITQKSAAAFHSIGNERLPTVWWPVGWTNGRCLYKLIKSLQCRYDWFC